MITYTAGRSLAELFYSDVFSVLFSLSTKEDLSFFNLRMFAASLNYIWI